MSFHESLLNSTGISLYLTNGQQFVKVNIPRPKGRPLCIKPS